MTTPHKHADNMLLFAQDAQLTDDPWALWQRMPMGWDSWITIAKGEAMWHENNEYRRKPPAQKYITIGDIEVPEPLRVAPKVGTCYWYFNGRGAYPGLWNGTNPVDNLRLKSGIVHLNFQAAQTHRRAITELNNQPGH
jgi:hypothetical protein